MSTKGRVRRSRRTNTNDEESDVKHDDLIDHSDDNKSTISNDTDKNDSSLKEETNGHSEEADSYKSTEENLSLVIEKTNGIPETAAAAAVVVVVDNNDTETDKNSEMTTEEMEPLSVDSEESELQFVGEQSSDKGSEIDASPVINRCRTRRSHTRNLPTPKTPKVLEFNGDNSEKSSEISSNNSEIPQVIITIPDEVIEEQSEQDVDSIISISDSIEENKTMESDLANASICVNLGNDTTRNLDFTVQSNAECDQTGNSSSFLETTKDKTYGETLRFISGRKTTRNYEFKLPPRKTNIDVTDTSRNYSPAIGVKRKADIDVTHADKRMRTEDVSPGIFSYLTSPFKNKFGKTEIPSSTPKLTSFKYTHQASSVVDDLSKHEVDDDNKSTVEKKWCSIM